MYRFGHVGTHDATNSLEAGIGQTFIRGVGVESTTSFEIGIELRWPRLRRARELVTEIPTTWTDRDDGESRCDLVGWLPK